MSLTADAIVSYNLDDLSVIRVYDTSDYGTPNPEVTDVTATRFVFSSVNGQANRLTNVTALQANVEYELVGTGTMTIDGKVLTAGDKFILRVDVTVAPPSGLQIDETGYYSPVTSYLPTSDYEEFVPSQLNIQDESYFPDNIFTCEYDIFTTSYPDASLLPIGTYIVLGGGSILISSTGDVYNSGEVFTITASTSFDNVTGTNTVSKLESSTTFYFMTYKYAYQVYERYISAIAQGQCGTNLQANFIKVHSLLHANIINFEKDIMVDLNQMQDNLDIINTQFSNLYV
jgi:hypothetical protein